MVHAVRAGGIEEPLEPAEAAELLLAEDIVADQDVVDAAIGHHLGLAELLAGDAARAGLDLEAGEFGRFMRLDMRAVGDALGIADGLQLGHNSRAALITRGLAELGRLSMKLGANPMTLAGLSGMGDLVLTCTGDLSRNRRVGIELGQGRTLDEILRDLGMVAEGVQTAKSANELAKKLGVDMPITQQVHDVLYAGKPAKAALVELMTRPLKEERS